MDSVAGPEVSDGEAGGGGRILQLQLKRSVGSEVAGPAAPFRLQTARAYEGTVTGAEEVEELRARPVMFAWSTRGMRLPQYQSLPVKTRSG